MLAGIDPFTGTSWTFKIRWGSNGYLSENSKRKSQISKTLWQGGTINFIFRNAKSLVKHLLVADISKRYGCLKNGANDVKGHRWFKVYDWQKILKLKVPAPYEPVISYTKRVICI